MERLVKFFFSLIFSVVFCFETNAQTQKPVNPYFTIENGITPNGDGKNDVWKLNWLKYVDSVQITIYNRWGQIIVDSKQLDFEWSGRDKKNNLVQSGVYVYNIVVYNQGKTEKFNGSLSIFL